MPIRAVSRSYLRASPLPNLCDEGWRNDPTKDGHIPALLDMLDLPYTGAGPACPVTCYDKSLVRAVALSLGVPVPREVVVASDDPLTAPPDIVPGRVKPCRGDNSIGIDHRSVARTAAAATEALRRLRRICLDEPIRVQEFLGGAEYSIGLIGNPGRPFDVLPVLEVDYSALDSGLPHILTRCTEFAGPPSHDGPRDAIVRTPGLPRLCPVRLARR